MAKRLHPLRHYRVKHGLSCKEIGKRLGNIAETTVRSYENGNRPIDAEMAVKIEKALGIAREEIRPDLFRRAA